MHARGRRIAIAIGGGIQRLGQTRNIDREILRLTGSKHPHVVFLPTASRDREDYIRVFEAEYRRLGASVTTIRAEARRPTEAELYAIRNSNVVYLSGGDAQHLRRKLSNSRLLSALHSAYSSGTILAGISAGAAMLFPTYLGASKEGVVEHGNGLNLLRTSAAVFVHYDKRASFSRSQTRASTMIAIPDRGAVVFQGSAPISTIGAASFTFQATHGKYRISPLNPKH